MFNFHHTHPQNNSLFLYSSYVDDMIRVGGGQLFKSYHVANLNCKILVSLSLNFEEIFNIHSHNVIENKEIK